MKDPLELPWWRQLAMRVVFWDVNVSVAAGVCGALLLKLATREQRALLLQTLWSVYVEPAVAVNTLVEAEQRWKQEAMAKGLTEALSAARKKVEEN